MKSKLRTVRGFIVCILTIAICAFAISGSNISELDRAHLFPTIAPSFDTFVQYPNAQYVEETPWDSYSFSVDFETQDAAAVVKAYYEAIVDKYGWQSEPVDFALADFQGVHYYLGDYGKNYIYGYYLDFYAVPGNSHLATDVHAHIMRSLPIYLGAYDVKTKTVQGADTYSTSIDYLVAADSDAVLAFYRQSMRYQEPGREWHLVPEQSSDSQLSWRTDSIYSIYFAKVTVEKRDSKTLHVGVTAYH